MNPRSLLAASLLLATASAPAHAQSNVRAWSAHGQTWIVWEDDLGLRFQTGGTDTYSVHRRSATTRTTRVGELFPEDWLAGRLKLAAGPSATYSIPDGQGGTYALAPDEAVFAYTPHTDEPEWFTVVGPGQASPPPALGVGPITPSTSAVIPHAQHTGVDGGHPYTVYALWVDGHEDHESGTVASPVLGNPSFNGIAKIFCVFEPQAGLPAAPYPCVAFLHGGGGSYWKYRPSNSSQVGFDLNVENGLYVTFDNHMWSYRDEGVPAPTTTQDLTPPWFGYADTYDRFASPQVPAEDGAVVVDYTLRMLDHVRRWLVASQGVDADRFAMGGLSGGARGTFNYVRSRPGFVSAALTFVPSPSVDASLAASVPALLGTPDQDLPTPLPDDVGAFTYLDLAFQFGEEDLPFQRAVWGTNDTQVPWENVPDTIHELNDQRRGTHMYWDERGHTQGGGPWTGAHFFGSPRHDVQRLTVERRDRSFPAFFDVDHDVALAGTQPIPTDPVTFPFGTVGGWLDWDRATIADLPTSWAATLTVVGASAFPGDVAPAVDAETSLVVRRPQAFLLEPHQTFEWELRDLATGVLLQSGIEQANGAGRAVVRDLLLSTAPARLTMNSLPSAWQTLPGGTAGTTGFPLLKGLSTLQPGDLLTLRLTNGVPGNATLLVFGNVLLNLPALGGLLVPQPQNALIGVVNAAGIEEWTLTLPPTTPASLALYFQAIVADPVAIGGRALTNGLYGEAL